MLQWADKELNDIYMQFQVMNLLMWENENYGFVNGQSNCGN